MQVHNYECIICNGLFANKCNLNRHMKVHKKEKSTIHEQLFSLKNSWTQNILKFYKENIFRYSAHDERFGQKGRVNESLKANDCKRVAFSRSSYYFRHTERLKRQVHETEITSSCFKCYKTFTG